MQVKLIVLGDATVGKTCLLQRYVNNRFIEHHKATIGADIFHKEITVDGNKKVTLQLWDTAGQERFQSLNTAFFRGADACILVYDVTNAETFNRIDEWRRIFFQHSKAEYLANGSDSFPFLLLGNKTDICDTDSGLRQVESGQGKFYSNQHKNILFYETSAKTGVNVENAFNAIALLTYNKQKPTLPEFKQDILYLGNDITRDNGSQLQSSNTYNNCYCQLI